MEWLTTALVNNCPDELLDGIESEHPAVMVMDGIEWAEFSPRSVNSTETDFANTAAPAAVAKPDPSPNSVNLLLKSVMKFPTTGQRGSPLSMPVPAPGVPELDFDAKHLPCDISTDFTMAAFQNDSTAPPNPLQGRNDLQKVPVPISLTPLPVKKKRGRGAPRKHAKSTTKCSSGAVGGTHVKGSGMKAGSASGQAISAEEKRRIRAERNRESAEKSRLRRKQYTDDLERDVGLLRETNASLKARATSIMQTLQRVDDDVDLFLSRTVSGDSDSIRGSTALKAALLALENAKKQCPLTFGEGLERPEITAPVRR